MTEKSYPKNAIWHPIVEPVNAQEHEVMIEDDFSVLPDGTVSQYSRFVDILDSEFSLQAFPFDTQRLLYIIESFKYDARVVRFVEDRQRSGLSDDAFLAEWRFGKLSATPTLKLFPPEGPSFHV